MWALRRVGGPWSSSRKWPQGELWWRWRKMPEMLAAWNELDLNMDMRVRDNAQRSSSPKRFKHWVWVTLWLCSLNFRVRRSCSSLWGPHGSHSTLRQEKEDSLHSSRTDENHQGCPRGENLILGFWFEEISFLVTLQQSLHVFEFMLIQKQTKFG